MNNLIGPTPTQLPSKTSWFLLCAAAFVIIVAGLREAQSLVVPLLLSIFIAIISAPPLFWLERLKMPRVAALLVVVLGVLLLVVAIGDIVGSSLRGFSSHWPTYQARLTTVAAGALSWLDERGISWPHGAALEHVDGKTLYSVGERLVSELSGVFENAFLIFLTVLFILFEAESYPVKLRAIFNPSDDALPQFSEVTVNIRRYLSIKTLASLATGIAVVLCLAIIGVDYALLWGLLAFLLNFIPNIGSILAAVPPLLLALVQLGPGAAIWTAVAFLVIGNVIGNIIEPRFMGKGMGLSTLVVFVSLIFWGWVLGPVGMFLSVPLTMAIKIALHASDNTRWLAILMGTESGARRLRDDETTRTVAGSELAER